MECVIIRAVSHCSVIRPLWCVIRPETSFFIAKMLEGIINTRPTLNVVFVRVSMLAMMPYWACTQVDIGIIAPIDTQTTFSVGLVYIRF